MMGNPEIICYILILLLEGFCPTIVKINLRTMPYF